MAGGGTTTGRCGAHAPTEEGVDETHLRVQFCGQEWRLDTDGSLGFGRDAECTIDEANRYLHRVAGRFRHAAGNWWLRNEGSHLPLSILEAAGRPMVVLPPGVETTLWPGDFAVILEAGPARYELRGCCPAPAEAPDAHGKLPDGSGTVESDHTARWGVLDLNDDQRALLAALAEPRLRDPLSEPAGLPPNRQTALRLGWSLSKFNRKLDHLCGRLARHGVRGLQGSVETTASERRQNLVDHALSHRLVRTIDLELLDEPTGAQS